MGFSRQEYWSGLPFPSPMNEREKWKWSLSVVSDSSWPHGLQPTRLLHPWDFPGKSTGVECHCLLWRDTDLHLNKHQFRPTWSSLVAQMVKCLPAVQETRVRSLDQEDPLEKEMATHSSTLAGKIPWTEEPGRLQSMGSQRVGHDWATSLSLFFGIGMKTDLSRCGHCWIFQIFWHVVHSTFTASSSRIWNSSTGIPSLH